MDEFSHKASCPECQKWYDISSLATHLCFEHGFCPFCFSEKCITESLYPELTFTRREVVSRLSQIYRKISNDILAARETGFSLEACSSIYSTYIATFSPLCRFSYGLPSPVAMLVHMIIEHPAVGYRLLTSLTCGESLTSVYARVSSGDLMPSKGIQLCPECFLFYSNAIGHRGQCKRYYRNHFMHYLHYRSYATNDVSTFDHPMHTSVEMALDRYFCSESLRDNFQSAKRYMGIYILPNRGIAKDVEDSLRGYFTNYPTFESLKHPGRMYKIESLELQGSYAFGKVTIYSDMDFHLLVLMSDGADLKELTSEDTQDCLSSLITHLRAPSSDKWLAQISVDKPIKYFRGTTGFIELALKGATQSISLVFGNRSLIATGRQRITVIQSFYADKYSIYERAEAFLKQWLFMSRTTEGSTAMGLTKFTSLTLLQRICLFTDVVSLCKRFICYDPDETYEPMLDPSSLNNIASDELLSLYQWQYNTNSQEDPANIPRVLPNSELVDPAKFKQLVIDSCADKQSRRGTIDAILDLAETPEAVSFIWVFMLIHEVLRYHRDFYRDTIECKLILAHEVSPKNIMYNLRDLLSMHGATEHSAAAGARPCVSTHVIKTMTLACAFRTLLTVETSMMFLRCFLPTPYHISTTDRETLQSLHSSTK